MSNFAGSQSSRFCKWQSMVTLRRSITPLLDNLCLSVSQRRTFSQCSHINIWSLMPLKARYEISSPSYRNNTSLKNPRQLILLSTSNKLSTCFRPRHFLFPVSKFYHQQLKKSLHSYVMNCVTNDLPSWFL